MRRREFIAALGGAAAWPLLARGQQPMPVIGFLSGASPEGFAFVASGFRKGLSTAGFVGGQNVAIEYRWGNGQYDRMPELAADLVRRPVAVLLASGGDAAAWAAKAATSTIPIVAILGGDPVATGFVASLARPGGNLTGVTLTTGTLEAKRLELLHQMVPAANMIGVLMNPKNPRFETDKSSIQAAAEQLGIRMSPVYASDPSEFEQAFETAFHQGASAIVVASDPVFVSHRERIVALATKRAIPAVFQASEFVKAGGLFSYGPIIPDLYRQAGIYTGRILKGSTPGELPVLQPTRYELYINLKTAKQLGLEVPMSVLLLADEVIE